MKAKFTISLLLIFGASAYLFVGWSEVFTSVEKSAMIKGAAAEISDTLPPGNQTEPFLIGAMESGIDTGFQNLDDAGFNLWHLYSEGNSGWYRAGVFNDTLNAPIEAYRSGVQNKLHDISDHGMKSILMRPKIAMLCYGQRSDYQCDSIPLNDDLWFYSFHSPNHVGVDINDTWQGQTQRVRYMQHNVDDSGMVVSKLKSNAEQCNTFAGLSGIVDDDIKKWIVKPRIRIDSTVAHSIQNPLVCKVKVIGQLGDVLKEVNIQASYFLNSLGNYGGEYIEDFSDNIDLKIDSLWGLESGRSARGSDTADYIWNHVDIQVYWYGNCDMWIDYVRVDNMVAHDLLSNNSLNPRFVLYQNWLQWEAQDIACYSQSSAIRFYMELFAFANIPCMSYVSRKLDSLCDKDISLTALMGPLYMNMIVPWRDRFSVMNTGHVIRNYAEKVGLRDILIACYPFFAGKQTFPYNNTTFSKIPNTLPRTTGDSILAYPVSPSSYDTWLQNNLDYYPHYFEAGSTANYPWNEDTARQWEGAFRWSMEMGDAISKAKDIPFIYNGQSHLWYNNNGESHKEPTNEEMEMLANLPITYGARGLLYFFYGYWDGSNCSDSILPCYGVGFVNDGNIPRTSNAYRQNKWEKIKEIVQKIKTWEPYIMSFDNTNRKTYILRSEYSNLYSQTYFSDVVTYKPFVSNPPCDDDNPNSGVSGLVYECRDDRYLQVATFQNSEPNTNYFMIVNRRCSPFLNDSTNSDNNGGRRFVKINLDSGSSSFAGFNNWSIYDLENDSLIITFDKTASSYLGLGWFMPGEGKLYKVAPVMQEGGTLVADEEITPGLFDCKNDVTNGGKNVTINPNVTVNFAEGVKWDFQGGEINLGAPGNNNTPSPVTFNSFGSGWKGITLNQCYNVEIGYSIFNNIKNSSTALQIIDCSEFIINQNTFNLTNLDSVIAIGVDYLMPSELQAGGFCENCEQDVIYTNAVINNNTFNISDSKLPTLKISAYSLYVVSLMADRNTFNSTSGNLAIFLSNVAAGNLKNNKIYNYKTGVNVLSLASYADLYNNEISADSVGIQINNGAINLGQQAPNYTGGFNRISAGSSSANDVKTVLGYFYTESGLNTFNINNNSTAYHFGGTYNASGSNISVEIPAEENCFKLNGSETTLRENVNCISGFNCDVTFTFDPTVCAINQTDDYFVIDVLGDSTVFDTIWTSGEGGGGGERNYELGIKNYELESNENIFETISEVETESLRELYNSICIEMRKRNYELVHTKCLELLDNYIDSLECIDALSKLYLADLVLDSSGSKLTDLKSLFETLILQNGDNENLVKKLFYLDQKCKVALGEYESAMDGFEQIINQNPYNYEGLVASWDYAATSLLLQGNGGGGKNNLEIGISELEFEKSNFGIGNTFVNNKSQIQNPEFQIFADDPNDKYDSKKFNKEDRKVIRENVFKSYKTSREKEIEIVKTLETKVSEGIASEEEKKELQTKQVLSEIVKAKEPADIAEHIKIVNDNIQKIFCSENNVSVETDDMNNIPSEYYLSQNYPNPFNPLTKIRFDLSHDSRVKLIVYDILGREVKTMVNSDLSTGRYEYEFEGSNFASGVYFYRIETVEYSGKKFVQTKRMVLLK